MKAGPSARHPDSQGLADQGHGSRRSHVSWDPEDRKSQCVQEATAVPMLEQRQWLEGSKNPCRAVGQIVKGFEHQIKGTGLLVTLGTE